MVDSCVRCGGQLDERAFCPPCAHNSESAEDYANAREREQSSAPRDPANTVRLFTFNAIAQYVIVPNRIYVIEGYSNRLDFLQKGSQLAGGSYLTGRQENDPKKLIWIGLALLLGSAALAAVVWQFGSISDGTLTFAVIGLLILARGLLIVVNPKVRNYNMSVAMSDIEGAELFTSFKSIHLGMVPVAGRLILQLNNGEKLDLAISAASDIEIIKLKLLPMLGSRVQLSSKKEFDSVLFVRVAIVLVVAAAIAASVISAGGVSNAGRGPQ
jgi:hypothetical protein